MDSAEITELKIFPKNRGKLLAHFTATVNNELNVRGAIVDGSRGIRVKPSGFWFVTAEARRKFSNRVLATYVINHCIDDNAAAS